MLRLQNRRDFIKALGLGTAALTMPQWTMSSALYNLKEGIGEQNNLVEKNPEKARELQQILVEWRKSVDADMPVPNPDFDEKKRDKWGKHPDRK